MTLIKVKNYKTLDMPSLVRVVLKFIYERRNLKPVDIDMMIESFKVWKKHFDHRMNIGFSAEDIENQLVLKKLLEWLDMEARGEFEGKKLLVKRHKLDYRKLSLHRLPEAYTKKDFEVAKEIKKEYDDAHKEQEAVR